MKELIQRIAEYLVDQPDHVSVTEKKSGNTIIYEVRVAIPDLGKIIGKRGRNADAIRTILKAVAGKTNNHVILDVIEGGMIP
jgi:predicted RNA-binding protein YlqC (UPF0109 family)